MPTQVQYEYLSSLLGIDLLRPADGDAPPAASANAPGDDAAPGGPADGKATDGPPLAATDTEIFFAKGSTELTASDTKSLDAYAASMAATSDAITAYGYASVDGDPVQNAKLATARAKMVEKYLTDKGIGASRITAEGHGFTAQFGEKDLPSNRRVMLAPKPQARPAPPPAKPGNDEFDKLPPDAPLKPGELPPNLRLTPDQLDKILGPDKGVPRAQVEKEFTDFLEQLMKNQGGKSLKITDTVRFAGDALAKGTKNENAVDAKLRDNGVNRVPAELAAEVAKLLPDFIPRENFDNFLKMKPKDVKPPEKFSVAGAITKILTPTVKKAISFLPKPIQEKIEKSIEDAVVKGLVAIADQAMSEANLDDETKKAIHSAVEAAIKEKGDSADKK